MAVGDNILRATLKSDGKSSGKSGKSVQANLAVKNYSITGPISPPHLTPYECRTVDRGLANRLMPTARRQQNRVFYRASNNAFKPLDPNGPRPSDLVNTTTTTERPCRISSAWIGNHQPQHLSNRDLDDPKQAVASAVPQSGQSFTGPVSLGLGWSGPASSEWRPGQGWNRKLAVSFGGGAGTQYNQGVNQATAALNHVYLSRGFAYMISTELVNQQHGNAVLQGETLMMLKEYFIERYGVPKWTVGYGGSGGAIRRC